MIANLHRRLPRLVMAVGVIAEHSVAFGKEAMEGMDFNEKNEYFLKNYFKEQTSLIFEIKRVSLLNYLFTRKI